MTRAYITRVVGAGAIGAWQIFVAGPQALRLR
jgi:hypothetical protein